MNHHPFKYLRFIGDVLSNLLILVLEFELLSPHVIAKPAERRLAVLLAWYQYRRWKYPSHHLLDDVSELVGRLHPFGCRVCGTCHQIVTVC
jgi:hypothetical protein